jgi:hypothetical protein
VASSAWHHPKGDIGDPVNASRSSRKEQDRFGHCGAGICAEAHHLFPSPRMAQTQHPLPQCAMKPTVFDQRNLSNLHTLTLAHREVFTRRRAALDAGRADVSLARSASLRTSVKEALTSFAMPPAHYPISYQPDHCGRQPQFLTVLIVQPLFTGAAGCTA